jgi:hypothetical protein
MSATFTWTIANMQVVPQLDGQTDVVVQATWVCTGVEDANGKTYTNSANGGGAFTAPQQGQPFTPYDQLTQEQVLGWVWQTISQEKIESGVQGQLNNQINPPTVDLPLPWVAPEPTSTV